MTSRLDFTNLSLSLVSASLYVLFYFSTYTRYFDEANIVPPPLILLLTSGISVGIIIGIISTARITKSIEQKGEYMYTHRTLMWLILGLAIYFATTITSFILNILYGFITLNFVLASLVAITATQLVLTVFWEMKNEKLIMSNTKPNKLYTVPRVEKTD